MAKESSGRAASQKQLIMVGVMFAVLLGVVYFMFLKGGGEEPVDSTAPAPAAEATSSEEESTDKNAKDEAEAPKKKGKGPVETSEVFGGKDPFEAVLDLNPDAGGGAAVDDGTTDATVPATDDGTGTTPTTPTPPTAPAPAPPTTPPTDDDDDDDEVKTGYRVNLVKIFSDGGTLTAQVNTVKRDSWDKQEHELVAGERFRKHFKITSMDKDCASFLFDGEWFALCEGQRVIRK